MDRLSRSLADLIATVTELRRRGVGFRSLHEQLYTTTPGGRLVFHVFAALAEFIRELIVEGTREGLDAARVRGRVGGQPPCDDTGEDRRGPLVAARQQRRLGWSPMLGVELLPRLRNCKDLIFYRPAADARYGHIDSLFGEDEAIDWKLIETHWVDLMRVVISIRQGRISSPALLRRLGNESHRNRVYKAFRELGRATRTIVLLRWYLSEPDLRESITTITNRVESFHNFSKWLSFGNAGVIGDNDPDHMEKIIKFNKLLANCVIFYNAAKLTVVLNQLTAEEPSCTQ